MLQNRSVLQIVDNTDVLEVRCFWVRGSRTSTTTASIGDIVTASVVKVKTESATRGGRGEKGVAAAGAVAGAKRTRRGDVVHALVVQTTKPQRSRGGWRTQFQSNCGVLITHNGKEWVPVGSRVNAALPRSLRTSWPSVLALSTHHV